MQTEMQAIMQAERQTEMKAKRQREEFNEDHYQLGYLSNKELNKALDQTNRKIKEICTLHNETLYPAFKALVKQIRALSIDVEDEIVINAMRYKEQIESLEVERDKFKNLYHNIQKEQQVRKTGTEHSFFLESGYEKRFHPSEYVFFNPNLHHVTCIKYK